MRLNRLQRAVAIIGLLVIGVKSATMAQYIDGRWVREWIFVVTNWAAIAAITIALMLLVGTRWRKPKKEP